MRHYLEINKKLHEMLEVKENKYGSGEAVKINNYEEFELFREWERVAYSPGCGGWRSIEIDVKGEYNGPDWYFPMHSSEDLGGAHLDSYWIESLGERKNRFRKFCERFEGIGCEI